MGSLSAQQHCLPIASTVRNPNRCPFIVSQLDWTSQTDNAVWSVCQKHLIELGYGPSFAADIIKKAKELMVEKGHTYYQSRKLDRVPKEAVEELLGITLPDKQE